MRERKEKMKYEKEHGSFVLNQITGEMQLLSKVERKECNKCRRYKTFATQVCPLILDKTLISVYVQIGKLLCKDTPSCSKQKVN